MNLPRLRQRISEAVIPRLAHGLAIARGLPCPSAADLAETWTMTLTVLFRLLFITYAEDKDLLPYRFSGLYQRHSLKTRTQEILELLRQGQPFPEGDSLWEEFDRLCRAVEQGNPEWGVPAYGGDLFERDPAVSRIGSLLAGIKLSNNVLGPVLRDLLLIDTPEGLRPVDFRSLGVREFGTIYEGLLESELAVAEIDLGVDREGYYRPWREGQGKVVSQGEVYLHNRSGARKATGTWFTREFAVDHLLDRALEPALVDHLTRLDDLDDDAASDRFFDFQVADIAMGAAHFLVAAVDRIERAFTLYLARRPLAGVRRELADLRAAALKSLGSLADQVDIADVALLRRLIARHCIYGVDITPIAVTLARLSIWIHTFVQGLPLSLLDHNLVVGNSLVGIGIPAAFPEVFLRERAGFDVIVGNPPWQEATVEEHAFWARHHPGLRGLASRLREAEIAKLKQERGDLVRLYEEELAQAKATRRALTAGTFPGMDTGDPDLYKAFCWRFWHLVTARGGWIGVVLPRSALNAKGSTPFRWEVFHHADPIDLTILVNNRQWVFPEVHPQYSIGLLAACKRESEQHRVWLRGPFRDFARFTVGARGKPAEFTGAEVLGWTESASLPLLPTEESLEIFAQLRKSPRLDLDDPGGWRARPHTELHATNDKHLLDLASTQQPAGFWPVYTGESFDLWQPDTGRYYGWANPQTMLAHLQNKRRRCVRWRNSPFSGFSANWARQEETLPCRAPRLAFRDVTRATDTRTVRVALLPPNVFLVNQAPALLWPRGSEADQAYLLGILSSLPLDWYARRFVETHLNFFLFNPLPIPRPHETAPLRQRIVELAGRLASPDDRFAEWAEKVGVPCGPLSDAQKQDHIHELDAVVAHLYGLTEPQLVHIFATFHEGWDNAARRDATLRHFRALAIHSIHALVYHDRPEKEHAGLTQLIETSARTDEHRQEIGMARRTIAEALRAEGEQRGHIRSRQEMLLRALRGRFSEVPAEAEQRILQTHEISQLEEWFDRALVAKSIAEVGISAAQ